MSGVPSVIVVVDPGRDGVDAVLARLAAAGEQPLTVAADEELPTGVANGAVVLVDLRSEVPVGPAGDLPRLGLLPEAGRAAAAVRALEAGITTFAGLEEAPEDLGRALAAVRAGGSWVSPALVADVVGAASGRLAEVGRAGATRDDERRRLEAGLAGAGSLRPVFQPIVDLRSRQPAGLLALTRFADGDAGGGVAARFAQARRLGLSVELEVAAARAALAAVDHLPPRASLFVKVSSATVASGRVGGLVPDEAVSRIVLEVSEPVGPEQETAFATEIGRLRDRGFRFSVDETGAGFGALDQILDLAPSFIRLAGGLTRGIDTDRTRRALALAVVSFASHLGARVIADQIETEDELRALRRLGVDLGLGFHIAPPAALAPPDAEPEAGEGGETAAEDAAEPAGPEGASRAALVWATSTTGSLPVTPRMLSSLDEAARNVLRLLANRLPGASVHLSHLDADHGVRRIVLAAGEPRPELHPGAAVPLPASVEGAALEGTAPQASDPAVAGARPAAELEGAGIRSWATVPFEGTLDRPLAFVTAIAPSPAGLSDALELLRAGGAGIRAAAEREHGGRPDDLEAALRDLSWRDRFTGLLNAARFSEMLADANARASADPGAASVVQLRLSNFASLCDRLGQALGELVLKDVAHALARHVADVDTVAFIGGSTFACLLFGREDKEIGYLCREVAAEVRTGSRRRGATAELRAGWEQLGLDPAPATAWRVAGERLADPVTV